MIAFTKYHGLGNDFLLVDRRGEPPFPNATAVAMCDRRFGIGADGVLVAENPQVDADIRMRIINPDGTEPEMCGNGLRCFVKYAVDRLSCWSNPLRVETGAGLRVCDWTRDETGLVATISVSMGAPRLERPAVPMAGEGPSTGAPLPELGTPLGEGALVIDGVSMGNPHGVVFGSADPDRASRLGPAIQRLPLFPEGVNVGFAEVVGPAHLRLVVFERGCGLTLACGTGACAAVAAATRRGALTAGADVRVDLPGGTLAIRLEPDWSDIRMTGPATLVCEGVSYL